MCPRSQTNANNPGSNDTGEPGINKEDEKIYDFGRIVIGEIFYNDVLPAITEDASKFVLSSAIVADVAVRYYNHKDLIEKQHPRIDGSDEFKIAGYLTYWIAKLKPVQILQLELNEEERYINEYLAIAVANAYLYKTKHISICSERFVNDLKYLLRYRTLTVRIMPLIYESYYYGYVDGRAKPTRD